VSKLARNQGQTSNILEVFIRNSGNVTGAGLTGLGNGTAGLTAFYHRNTAAAPGTSISIANMTVGTFASGGFREVDSGNMAGVYQFCPPDAAFASGAQSVTVLLAGAANMAPVVVEIDLQAQVDVTRFRGNASLGDPGYAGVDWGQVANKTTTNALTGTSISSVGNVTVNVQGNVTGNVGGNLNGNVLGNVAGNLAGNVQGNVLGNVAGNLAGSVLGNLAGNVAGNVNGSVLGNVSGNVAGNVNGNLLGNVAGNVNGSVLGYVTGNVSGNVNGNVLGNVAGNLQGVISTAGNEGIADALLGRTISGGANGGRTVATAFYFIRNKWDVAAGVLTVYGIDDSTPSWTANVSSSASADPIIGNDPS